MLEMIEQKIAQLKGEVEKGQNAIAQLMHNVSASQAQIKIHEANVQKLTGAIEAFQSTINVLSKVKSANEVDKTIEAIEVASMDSE